MVVLTGKNLGERHRELNSKVADVVANKQDFGDMKHEEETTDIDKLYKIDIASQYKDVDYIVEVLKAGDSLYISRALKCVWLYEDTYSHVINTENLHDNIFPFMSLKMITKTLSTISMYIRNKDRAASFYTYCMNNKMSSMAMKFLTFTSEEFKLDTIKNQEVNLFDYFDTQKTLKNFIGNSFLLGINYIEANQRQKQYITHNLRFLYTVCNEKYLDILENYESVDVDNPNSLSRFGIRISKDIMMKHKNRVLNNPLLYVNKLNKSMLTKHSTSDDVKKFIPHLMPDNVAEFWRKDFCDAYSYVLDLIPINEKFEYVKQMFSCKYPNEEFEMAINFYDLKYYNMLPINERELWAFRHINSEKEILGNGNDYNWYKFVEFDKAFVEIKKCIMITPDKRSNMLNILVESAKDQNDLIKLLNYYYDRHVNEKSYEKENFLNKVLHKHNVFEFNIECWESLNKLFYSLKLYNVGNYSSNKVFQAIAVACHILHNKDLPKALKDFIDLDVNYSYFQLLLEKMGKDKSEIVFQYILKLFVDKLEPFEQDLHKKKLREKLVQYVYNINNLLSTFHKRDEDCPKIVTKFMEFHSPESKIEEPRIVTSEDILRLLKKDANLSVQILSVLAENINYWPKRFNRVFRKLKVYFPNDVAKEYTNFFHHWLPKLSDNYNSYNLISTAVYAIFVLGDESLKISLMEKYQPVAAKIDHGANDSNLLYIQEAICRLVGYSRPPVPLQNVLQYIKGDYVRYCLPMFNMYLANFPLSKAIEFTEATLNAPLSVQKHSLRIAFRCYTINNLKDLVVKVWKKSKNVSLRLLIYKSLFNKLIDADHDTQAELYEVLKFFTSDLHKGYHNDIFNVICSYQLPDRFVDDYLQTCWDMIIKLPQKLHNISRQILIINKIERESTLVNREFIYKRIIEEHIDEILVNKRLRPHEMHEMEMLCDAKWNLTATYICHYRNRDEMEENLKLMSYIFEKCRIIWNELHNEKFISRKFYFGFVQTIKGKSLAFYKENSVPIIQHILDTLQKTLPITEMYLTVWELQLVIYALNSEIGEYDRGENHEDVTPEQISVNFAKQIGTFVKELVDKKQFYTVFLRDIASLLKAGLARIKPNSVQYAYFNMMFCESLANVGMKETHMLTLIILNPKALAEFKEIHTRILKTVQKFKDDEVQSFLYTKFV
ncbi:uncharacterized protein [Epargyreus clarus]|uniref:uncharacterized protein n=1 Tax=Epargyreus clarus TaxID=520877 RepID=UPI003C3083A4